MFLAAEVSLDVYNAKISIGSGDTLFEYAKNDDEGVPTLGLEKIQKMVSFPGSVGL
eukprot:Awhi_evm1s15295